MVSDRGVPDNGETRDRLDEEARRLVGEVLASRGSFLGFGLLWAWMELSLQASFVSAAPDRVSSSPGLTLDLLLPVLFYALGFVVWLFVGDPGRAVRHRMRYLVLVVALASSGGALCLAAGFAAGAPRAAAVLYVAGSAATGIGAACLNVEWARHLGGLGARRTVAVGACGIVFAAALSLALYAANGLAVVIEEASGVPVTAALLGTALALLPVGSVKLMLDGECVAGAARRHERAESFRPPWKLMATTLLMGISFGAMDAVAFDVVHSLGFVLSVASHAAGAVTFLAFSTLRRPDYNVLFYKMGFPAMAAGWLVASAGALSLPAGVAVHSVAYGFSELALWTLMATFIKHRSLPPHLVCSISMASLTAGRFAGVGLMQLVRGVGEGAGYGQACTLLAFALVVAALYLRDSDGMRAGWGLVRPGGDAEPVSDVEFACGAIATECDLTRQERIVFAYLVKGRNKGFIAKEMVLSPETVKVHMRHIYRKLEVHSQQELMTKVERYLDSDGA